MSPLQSTPNPWPQATSELLSVTNLWLSCDEWGLSSLHMSKSHFHSSVVSAPFIPCFLLSLLFFFCLYRSFIVCSKKLPPVTWVTNISLQSVIYFWTLFIFSCNQSFPSFGGDASYLKRTSRFKMIKELFCVCFLSGFRLSVMLINQDFFLSVGRHGLGFFFQMVNIWRVCSVCGIFLPSI